MFEWDDLPHGATAQIYLPGSSADEILALAGKLYLRHDLARHDAHTITCAAQGITYMPVPAGSSNYAGLLTVELPPTASHGSTYKVITRQLRNTAARRPAPPPPPPPVPTPALAHAQADAAAAISEGDVIRWRRVIGTFQLSIPVSTKDAILPDEERLLSVLRHIYLSIPAT